MPRLSKSMIAAMSAGLGTLGLINIDVRPDVDEDNLKDLDEMNYANILKPGDVMVGAETTPDDAIDSYKKDFRKNYIKARKKGGVASSVAKAVAKTYPRSITSKIIHPAASHTELVTDPETSIHIGRGEKKIKDILDNKGAHFVVMRQKKNITPKKMKRFVSNFEFTPDEYDRSMTFKAALKDAITPKLRREERDKTRAEEQLDRDIKSGNCATIPAMMDDTTVGGKSTTDVLPIDYTRASDWEPVGYFGLHPKEVKYKGVQGIAYATPKALVQGAVAGGAGVGTFALGKGLAKALKILKK